MNQFELGLLDSFTSALKNPFFDFLMPKITMLANSGWIWIVVAVLMLLFRQYRKAGITLSLALISELIFVNAFLKPFFDRIRPFQLNPAAVLLVKPPADGSFPSGHTAVSFAAAYVIYHYNKKWGIAAYILATLIAFSRLYLYLHFPTDVLGGIIIGTLIGIYAIWLSEFVIRRWIPKRIL